MSNARMSPGGDMKDSPGVIPTTIRFFQTLPALPGDRMQVDSYGNLLIEVGKKR